MENLVKLAKEIKTKRLSLNLSMDELAKKASITRATLSSIEQGNPSCSIGSYLKIAEILDIKISIGNKNKTQKRKRATRFIKKDDKKINRFIIYCVENYAEYSGIDASKVYFALKECKMIDFLREDYEGMHGMGREYIIDYLDPIVRRYVK